MRLEGYFAKVASPTVVLAGMLSLSAVVVAQAAPDAQVEAAVLKGLASAPELTTQNISTTTVYGTVTLSGSVQTEAQRQRAEQIAANTSGVKKVVDELTLGTADNGQAQQQTSAAPAGSVLMSDGTYAPADAAQQQPQGNPQAAQQGTPGQAGAGEVPPPNGPDTDPYGRPLNGQNATGQNPPQGMPSAQPVYPSQQPAYGQNGQPSYGSQGQPQYSQPPYGPPQARRPYYPPYGPPTQYGYNQPQGPGYGQVGGQTVTIPSGTVLQVRVNQHLSSRDIKAGTPFDAMVVNDIVSDGQVAIPRGTSVQGTVVDATSSGTLKGRGELGLQLTQITLGGKTFPVVSDVFTAHGGDKTLQTVNSTVGLGALGAIFGAVAGGGAGAAIGAGVGGAVGLGASAASGRGDVFIPSEAVLHFRLTQPASVTTVSQAELQRLGYGVPAGGPQMVRRYAYPPPPVYYYGPVYYPRYYRGGYYYPY